MQTLKESGDILEKSNLDLLSKIKNYEIIWANYIGNNGYSQPISIESLSIDKTSQSRLIWQYNYSIFRNLLILQNIENNELATHNLNNDAEKLLNFEIQLITTVFTIYNTIEIFDKVNAITKESVLKYSNTTEGNNSDTDKKKRVYKNSYSDFMEFRNCVTHDLRLVYKEENNSFLIPYKLNVFANPTKENLQWQNMNSSAKDEDFQTLTQFIRRFYEKIISDFNIILEREIDFFNENNFPVLFNAQNLEDSINIISGAYL